MATATLRKPRRPAAAKRPGGRSARVRRAVFDATLTLLARDGYQALTYEAVAAASGVNKTTIYRNWPTKAALLLAAAKNRSEALITTKSTGDAERDLVAFLTSVAESITSPVGQALVIATLNEAHEPGVRRAREEFWRERFDAAAALIRAVAGGRVTDTDTEALIERLIGPLFLRVFITGAAIDPAFIEATARAAVRLATGRSNGG